MRFCRANQEKKQKNKSTNIERNEIDIMNFINDNYFDLHNSLLNNHNRCMKVNQKS